MVDSKRNTYMDFLRGLAIMAVIVGHSVSHVSKGYILCNIIYSFHMPLLMFISAYIEEENKEKYITKKWKMLYKRACGLLIPYIVWNILYELISGQLWEMDMTKMGLQLLGYTQTGLWFFPVLFGLKVLHCIYWSIQKKIPKYRNTYVTSILLCCFLEFMVVLLAVFTRHPYIINMLSYAIPYFLAVLVAENGGGFGKIIDSEWVTAGAFCVYFFLFPLFAFDDTNWTTQIIKIVLSICIIIICCKFQKRWKQNKFYEIICVFGNNSLAIYVLHGFFIDYTSYLNMVESAYMVALLSVLFAFTIAGVCVGIVRIIECSVWCGKILFGK